MTHRPPRQCGPGPAAGRCPTDPWRMGGVTPHRCLRAVTFRRRPPTWRHDRTTARPHDRTTARRHDGMTAGSSRTAERRRQPTGLAKGHTYLAVHDADREVRTYYLLAGRPMEEPESRPLPRRQARSWSLRSLRSGSHRCGGPGLRQRTTEVESLISGRGGRSRTCGIRFWRPALWPSELHPFGTRSLPRAPNPDPQIFPVGPDGDRSSTTSGPEHPLRAAARSQPSAARAHARSGRLPCPRAVTEADSDPPCSLPCPALSPGWTARPGSTAPIRER